MKKLLAFIFIVVTVQSYGQNTVGLLSYSSALSHEGYNLVYPHNQSSVFLLNNCGEIVHTWEDSEPTVPGNSVYITEQGTLVKCSRLSTSAVNDPIWAGGGGETVEILSWDNEPIASYRLNDSMMRLHHDVAPLPNGNILMIAWENRSFSEVVTAGRDPSTISQERLWPEVILEWDPLTDSIVWTWKVWDHLIQDFDPTKENFGVVADHPELVDINYDEQNGHPDWLHMNSIDYNPVLDQIVMSVPYFNELWMIDHSTTTEEAAGSSGGRSGRGGDLLYRWGNPKTYRQNGEQMLFFQHDVHWSDSQASTGDGDFGQIVLFNNRVSDVLSTANVLQTPITNSQFEIRYELDGTMYGPLTFDRTVSYPGVEPRSHSNSLSSAQLLSNGNMLVCAGRWGFGYEVTPNDDLAWEYIVPLKGGNAVEQGDTTLSINNNITFRIKRYDPSFLGFEGRDLTPQGYIELNPQEDFCDFLLTSTDDLDIEPLTLYPNPATINLTIEREMSESSALEVYDDTGRIVDHRMISESTVHIDVSMWPSGLYVIRLDNKVSQFVKQ